MSRYDQKLEFILRSAARIFAQKSYHSTSMRDISRATNVSLAGLYHYAGVCSISVAMRSLKRLPQLRKAECIFSM